MKSAQYLKQAQTDWATFVINPGDFNISIFEYKDEGCENGVGYEITIDGHGLFNNHSFDSSDYESLVGWMGDLFDEEPTITPFRKHKAALNEEQQETLAKSIAQAIESEPAHQVESEQMRKLRTITEAAQSLIVEIDSPIKSEKAQMAGEVIDSLEKAVNFKPTERLDAASRNTLRMKFFKGLGDYEVYDNNIRFTFDTEARIISGWIGESKYDIVKLDAGVSPDKWAMDGRRNWRPLKKFIDWVKTGAWEVEIYKQEDEQAMADFHQEEQMDAERAEEKAREDAQKAQREKAKKMWEKDLEELQRVWAEFTGNWKAFEEKIQWVPSNDKGRLYEILGIKEGDNVKSAYRSWMKKMHPDLNPNSDLALVQEVNALMDKIAKR